ncbi:MAG: carbohydrate ABC transporter permease [Saccharofermentanales bacterium]|jgi:multiple sugar transport system permease protein
MNMRKAVGKVLLYAGSFLFVLIFLFPFVIEFSVALKTFKDLFRFPSSIIPSPIAWENFGKIWEIVPLKQIYLNTYTVIFAVIAFNFFIAAPAAYAMSVLDFPFKKFILSLAFFSQMFVPVLIVVPVFKLIKELGLIDRLSSLILTGVAFTVSFVVLLMKGFFDTIPREVEEAALIDGCNRFMTMLRIYMPLCTSGIVVAIIYSAILVNNEFLFANTLINSTTKNVMSVALFKLIKANPYQSVTWNYVMVCAIYAGLPIQIIFLFIRKHITKGLTAGAIK